MKAGLSKHTRNRLLESSTFGTVTSKNRVVMAPMVTNFATTDNEITERQVTYYAERAHGEIGTIIVEAAAIHPEVRAFKRQVGIYDDRHLPSLSNLTNAIRAGGAVALIQLHHAGPKIKTELGFQPVSASSVQIREGDVPRQLSQTEIRQIRRDFVAAARRACQAGFDGVELHAAHLYLLSAFISPYTNRRNDAYGGDITHRSRFTREVIEDVKTALGTDFSVWVRINGCEAMDPGLSLEESGKAAAIFAEAGADAIHVSAYTIPANRKVKTGLTIPVGGGPGKDTPHGIFLDYAEAIRDAVDIPVVAVGKLDDMSLAATALTQGKCDMIALGRQLLCDPYWALKVKEGREKEIVHCNYCDTCHKALHDGRDIVCAQNLNLYDKPRYKERSL